MVLMSKKMMRISLHRPPRQENFLIAYRLKKGTRLLYFSREFINAGKIKPTSC